MTYVLGRSTPVAGKTDFHRPALAALARLRASGTVVAGLPLLLALGLLWEVAPRLGWMNPIFFPPLSSVLAALWDLVASGEMAKHIGISFQ
ncbi:MAG TPA: hypothetical protein VM899_04965, partial [Rubellimicrobium sp.]|nr:hypothetical protein [Rubellimicrobium sp.]